ncbi:MAG: cupin domain-containing protein [Dermatophilaceae bacterium]|nr:cupin domain-containing protein [Intrasporangiaceae bacterium]
MNATFDECGEGAPRSKVDPEPRAHDGREWGYGLSGRVRLMLGEQDWVLEHGEMAEFDTTVPHLFGSTGEALAEMLSMFGRLGERMRHRGPRPRERERARRLRVGEPGAGGGREDGALTAGQAPPFVKPPRERPSRSGRRRLHRRWPGGQRPVEPLGKPPVGVAEQRPGLRQQGAFAGPRCGRSRGPTWRPRRGCGRRVFS